MNIAKPLFTWGEQYLTGVEPIDQQHQKLANMINALHAAFQQNYGTSILTSIFEHLSKYLIEHIAFEEAMLERYGYPELGEHRLAHNAFNVQLDQQRQQMESNSCDQKEVIEKLLDFLKGWFSSHVLVSDMAYVPFVLSHMEEAEKQDKPRILVIDDEAEVLMAYQKILGERPNKRSQKVASLFDSGVDEGEDEDKCSLSAPFELTIANQGRSGIELSQTALDEGKPFSVAFIDMRMPPGIDGLETARALRILDERIYIIFVTAYADKSIQELDQAMSHDVLVLRKPFVREEIFQMALSLSRSWSRDRELESSSLKSEMGDAQHDITQSRVDHLLQHDPLTGLPNQKLLLRQLHQLRLSALKQELQAVLMVFQVSGLNTIQEVYGQQLTDHLIQQLASRLRYWLPERGGVAQLKRGPFALLMPMVKSMEDAIQLAGELQNSINGQLSLGRIELDISIHIGLTLVDGESRESGEELLNQALTAMNHRGSENTHHIHCYNYAMNQHSNEQLTLKSALRKASPQHHFVLHYQPQVDCKSHKIVGMEALLRWNNPQQGLMEPIQFIQQLESSKKIIEVGGWVLSESCKQAQKWSDLGNPLQVSVNISSRQLQSGTLQLAVEQALEESGLAAGQLELEVSESLFMGGDPEIRDQLDQLRQLGVQLTIDNFGTGCSSLKSLTQFALHTLKVDRSFMVDLVDNRQSQMLVSAIISMVHALGIKAVVEGVETREQMRLVEQMGADYVQGFLFSRALDVEQFQMLLDSSEVGRFQLDDQAAAATSLRSGE